ncbi:blue copper protein [Senna tora]|uniref:Blue copper protein n=1 Tax=Senna tora TaxID=362788 RepID=A0A834WW48_9FABA|nr:blue copper protein [Senna tora]
MQTFSFYTLLIKHSFISLVFNTDTNHSVVQTYNVTTYKLCDYNDAQDSDTFQWSSSNPSASEPQPVSVAVPLLKEGTTYFFSGDYDGEQCINGQNFKINVTYGQGLPESLKSPSDDHSPSPSSPVSGGDDDSAPDTVISSNFNHPKDQSEEEDDYEKENDKHKKTSGSFSISGFGSIIVLLLGLALFNFVLIL